MRGGEIQQRTPASEKDGIELVAPHELARAFEACLALGRRDGTNATVHGCEGRDGGRLGEGRGGDSEGRGLQNASARIRTMWSGERAGWRYCCGNRNARLESSIAPTERWDRAETGWNGSRKP